jgi:hypothetical protein
MPNHNAEVAAVFSKIADLLEIENANPFRVRAYRNAGRLIQGLSRDLREMVGRGEDLRFDAHSRFDFDHLRLGVLQARRGWLKKKDVLNTRSLPELRALLAQTRR